MHSALWHRDKLAPNVQACASLPSPPPNPPHPRPRRTPAFPACAKDIAAATKLNAVFVYPPHWTTQVDLCTGRAPPPAHNITLELNPERCLKAKQNVTNNQKMFLVSQLTYAQYASKVITDHKRTAKEGHGAICCRCLTTAEVNTVVYK